MITVAWGNFLSLILPGTFLLLVMGKQLGPVGRLAAEPDALELTGALALLLVAALLGIFLEALRTITFDYCLSKVRACRKKRQKKPQATPSLYEYVTPENFTVFQASIENSYKYYACYANLSLAAIVAIGVKSLSAPCERSDLWFIAFAIVMGVAAYRQDGKFYRRMNSFVRMEQRHAAERKKKGGANV